MATKLEVCIDNLAGLEACIEGNADRIELCSSLNHGGLTPTVELMKQASESKIPLRIMVRPKSANFHYSPSDVNQMKKDIDMAHSFGFEGVGVNLTQIIKYICLSSGHQRRSNQKISVANGTSFRMVQHSLSSPKFK